MAKRDFVEYHLREALAAGIAEAGSDKALPRRLRAEIKLRLIVMSDNELWELAKLTAEPLNKPVDQAYKEHKKRVEELLATASEWMNDLQVERDPAKKEEMPDKVLIIVDEPSLNEELTSVLEGAGFSVASIPDYSKAFLELYELKPDLVILDEVLPARDGIEACSELYGIFGIPVILLGKDPSAEIWKRAVDAGADFYLRKPFSKLVLVARVKAIFRRCKGKTSKWLTSER